MEQKNLQDMVIFSAGKFSYEEKCVSKKNSFSTLQRTKSQN